MPTALIVDDNLTLAFFTARNLRHDVPNLEVITAATCREARRTAQKYSPRIVIADYKLADGNGGDLARELRIMLPDSLFIIISGERVPSADLKEAFGFLQKPYDAVELANLVKTGLPVAPSAPAGTMVQEPCGPVDYDGHAVQNKLATLLVGLRALDADLRAHSHNDERITGILDKYIAGMSASVMEVSRMVAKRRSAEMVNECAGFSLPDQ